MKSNREMLDELFAKGKIDVRRGDLFGVSPEPMPPDLDFDRVEGMMLGLAVGDSSPTTSPASRGTGAGPSQPGTGP